MSGTIHDPGPGCRFILVANSIAKPAKWAARMNLGLRESCWIVGGSGELRVYRLDKEAAEPATAFCGELAHRARHDQLTDGVSRGRVEAHRWAGR